MNSNALTRSVCRCAALAIAAFLSAWPLRAAAQHQHADSARPTQASMDRPLGISMERMGSGTTWIPDAIQLPSTHFAAGQWTLMFHGFAFGVYDWQQGPNGGNLLGSLNWAMLTADHALAGGRFQLRFMPSLDAATIGPCGYPLLLQTGETCNGRRIVNAQHPHEFFKELGVLYERAVSRNLAVLLYAAPAGEPALGPVAFMHRPSAMDEPQAPLGHHWQDATHISFGVVTAGIFTRSIRLEASAFNGREPDEYRWNMDLDALSSYSARLTLNPTRNWSFTAGYGVLDEHDPLSPAEEMQRVVVSALHGRQVGAQGQWASAAVYGRNVHEHHESNSGLLESELVLDPHNILFGRLEFVEKSAEDLGLTAFSAHRLFNLGAASLGYIRDAIIGGSVSAGLGVRGTVNLVPQALESAYGSRMPIGGMVFVRLRPVLPARGDAAHVH
jgi:hypothetical protein